MKKRTKKYNPRVKYLKQILSTLKNKSFVHTSLDKSVTCFHNSRAQTYLINKSTITTLATERFKWSAFIAVFFKDVNGKINMKAESISVSQPLTMNEVAEFLGESHTQLIQSVNTNLFYGYGWLSCPFEYDWTEEQAFNLFHHTGITNPSQFIQEITDDTVKLNL